MNKYRVLPAAQDSGRSCRHWVAPPGWRRPRCLRSEGKCRWTRRCTGRSARHLPAGWRSLSPCRRSSCRCCCNTGRAAIGRPAPCACRWRSFLAGWCRTSVWCMLSQTPCLGTTHRASFCFVSKSGLKLHAEPIGLHLGPCYVRDKYVGVTVWCPGA